MKILVFALVTATIFSLMLTIGIGISAEKLKSVWADRAGLVRALVAVLVIVPAVAYVLLVIFRLPPEIATGVALLAASPGAPLTSKRAHMAAADPVYVAAIQLTVAFLAIVVTPLIYSLFASTFSFSTGRLPFTEVAWQVGQVTFLPVAIGIAARHFAPASVERYSGVLDTIANGLFLVMVVVLVGVLIASADLRSALVLGWPAVAVLFLIAASAITAGHCLGGPGQGRRSGLAIACLARNIGLAVYIANLGDNSEAILPTILVYMFVGFGLQIPYSVWARKQLPAAS